jgi:ABC-type transport system involved in multi-copper enzyme maturation permease subunit
MSGAPSARHVVLTIAQREFRIAMRRRFLRVLLVMGFLPPIVASIVLVIRLLLRQMQGVDIGWDPLPALLRFQTLPVLLAALGLGTPAVSRDRAEDVLYLYAVRPVSPGLYAAGKMLAVFLPAFLVLFLPTLLVLTVRQGILAAEAPFGDTLVLLLKGAILTFALAVALAGATVGPSAATKRGRWALLLALAVTALPDTFLRILGGFENQPDWAIGPLNAAHFLVGTLFEDEEWLKSLQHVAILLAWGAFGFLLTRWRVQREMIP